jgi:hypothetical protein
MDAGRFRKHESFSNAGIKRQKLETREEMRHGVQRPLLCRSTDLDGTPSWRQAIGDLLDPIGEAYLTRID